MYVLERKNLVAAYQSGFRRGRSTMDPVLCLEDEVRRAQVNKESVVAAFFDVEKACCSSYIKWEFRETCLTGLWIF